MREPHHVWRFTAIAWLALVAVPTAYAMMRWQMGGGRDPDMSGVGELVSTFVFFLTVPMGALAFGVFAPLAIAIDYIAKGRTTRFVNLLLGVALAVPALVIAVVVSGWPEHSLSDAMTAIRHSERAPGFLAALALAGIIVGFGLRRAQVRVPIVDQSGGN